jgi:opacity protein-like surface antigen
MQRILAALIALFSAPLLAAGPDCHLGVVSGYVFGRSQHVPAGAQPLTDTFDVEGRALGARFGCLAVRERWVVGAAVDIMDSHAHGSTQELAPNQNFFAETSFEWLGTVRLVSGYRASPRATLYLTGGLAASSVKIRVCAVTGGCGSTSEKVWGVVGGAGARYQFARRLSLDIEYLVFGFDQKGFSAPPGGFANREGGVNPEAQLVRAGLNFHF